MYSDSGCPAAHWASAVVLPQVVVVKTADQPTVNAGARVGFTVTITNEGAAAATGVTLSDLLPAGLGNDVNWRIDTSTGNAAAFTITGAVGNQVLILSGSDVILAPGASLQVHITSVTSLADAPAPAFIGTLLNTAVVSAANEVPALQNMESTATITINAHASALSVSP